MALKSIVNNKISGMSKEQLIQFILKKGNEKKKDQCEIAQQLTKDAQDKVTPIVQAMKNNISNKVESQRKLAS